MSEGSAVPIGFAFQYFDGRDGNHLHFVISRTTAPEAVVVNITEYERWSDSSCILDVGDHPSIHKKSCIAYNYACTVDPTDISRMTTSGSIIPRDRASGELLKKIWDGAAITRQLKLACQNILRTQSLI
jgi:hypothetical protein